MTLRLPCGHYLGPAYTIENELGIEVYHCVSCGRESVAATVDAARAAELEELL